jgi:hypothetical protein
MGNGFRRIALAQGLLPQGRSSDGLAAWTDATLVALLQIEDAPVQIDPALSGRDARQHPGQDAGARVA